MKNGVGVFEVLFKNRMAMSSGMEVARVYIMKYVPAVRRSACWPHRVMIIRVGIRVASNMMYIRVRLEAVNVSEIRVCRVMMVAMNVRCRCVGSGVIAYWLAISIKGKSQKDRVSKGAEIWSRFRYMFDDGLRNEFCFRKVRLSRARVKEYEIIVW